MRDWLFNVVGEGETPSEVTLAGFQVGTFDVPRIEYHLSKDSLGIDVGDGIPEFWHYRFLEIGPLYTEVTDEQIPSSKTIWERAVGCKQTNADDHRALVDAVNACHVVRAHFGLS